MGIYYIIIPTFLYFFFKLLKQKNFLKKSRKKEKGWKKKKKKKKGWREGERKVKKKNSFSYTQILLFRSNL